jgi:rubrerythrin
MPTAQHVHFNGIHHTTVGNGEEEILEAYLAFAYYHSRSNAEKYENAAANSRLGEQRTLFSQLACRKREVVHRLKINRSDAALLFEMEKKSPGFPEEGSAIDFEVDPLFTLNNAFDFAYRREYKTLAMYEKLAKAVYISSVRILFDYLVESQMEHIRYLDTQVAVANTGSTAA